MSREITGLDVLELLLRLQPVSPGDLSHLELARHGLQIVPYGGGVTFLSKGDILGNYADQELKRREFARHNARDGDAYAATRATRCASASSSARC